LKTGKNCLVFEWSASHLALAIQKPDKMVGLSNAIQILDHSTLGHKWTIQIPD
jgi:hypothetical protein